MRDPWFDNRGLDLEEGFARIRHDRVAEVLGKVSPEQWMALFSVLVGVVLDTFDNIRQKKLAERRAAHHQHKPKAH